MANKTIEVDPIDYCGVGKLYAGIEIKIDTSFQVKEVGWIYHFHSPALGKYLTFSIDGNAKDQREFWSRRSIGRARFDNFYRRHLKAGGTLSARH